jgi:hypothetical protein
VLGAARAIGWEFRRQHRWGLMALGGYVVVFWAIKVLILGPAYPVKPDPPNGMAGWVIPPVTATFFYFVGVFSYGLAGDLAARQSIYPARMFTLPVTSAALTGRPMLYGTAAASTLWVASRSSCGGRSESTCRYPSSGRHCSLPSIWPGRRRLCGCRTGCLGCA